MAPSIRLLGLLSIAASACFALPAEHVLERAACSPLELVISRGSLEFGPYGFIVGDNLVPAVKRLIPSATAYAVPYPANFDVASVPSGVAALQSHLSDQSKACPDQRFIIVGYSQGAVVSHNGVANLSSSDSAAESKIIGIVMFGDPYLKSTNPNDPNGRPILPFPANLQGDIYENCISDDLVCSPTGANFFGHLGYSMGDYISNSANFINKQYQATR